jgi:hypothetical protein
MLIGIQNPTLGLYFARNQLAATHIFGSVISLDRFESTCRILHFTDNTTIDTYQGPPKLFQNHSIIAHLNSKFQAMYLPSQCYGPSPSSLYMHIFIHILYLYNKYTHFYIVLNIEIMYFTAIICENMFSGHHSTDVRVSHQNNK